MTRKEKKAHKLFDILTMGKFKERLVKTIIAAQADPTCHEDIIRMWEKIDISGLEESQIEVLKDIFTEKQIDSLISLFSTPEYEMFQSKHDEYTRKSMEATRSWMLDNPSHISNIFKMTDVCANEYDDDEASDKDYVAWLQRLKNEDH